MIAQPAIQELTPTEATILIARLDSMLLELPAKEAGIVRRALIREGLPVSFGEPDEDVSWWAGDLGY